MVLDGVSGRWFQGSRALLKWPRQGVLLKQYPGYLQLKPVAWHALPVGTALRTIGVEFIALLLH
jgi:hypothetical protein